MQKLNLFQCHVCDFVGITAPWKTIGILPDPKASEVMGRPKGYRFRKTYLENITLETYLANAQVIRMLDFWPRGNRY